MRTRSLILLLLIIGIPLALLIWAAQRIARNERVVVRQQFSTVMEDRLQDVNRSIRRYFEETEAYLQRLTELDDPDTATLRHLTRTEPRVMQMFVLTATGELSYPDPGQILNGDENSFLLRAARMFTEQQFSGVLRQSDTLNVLPNESTVAGKGREPAGTFHQEQNRATAEQQESSSDEADSAAESVPASALPDSGWFVWYWDRGLNLIYWHRRPSGQIVGVALDRSRWMADVIAELPDSGRMAASTGSGGLPAQMRLLNAESEVVYQWGNSDPAATEIVADIPIVAPLASWRVQSLASPGELPGSGSGIALGLAGGLLAACVAVGLLAFVLFRDFQRDLREASRQVSFVNQVSHELKTPLTNIRLYAELLDGDLQQLQPGEAEQPRKRLDVILSEGQRLSRLIGNVLTFARQNRETLRLNRSDCIPDDVIRQVLHRFEPSLSALDIQIETQLAAADVCRVDPDFLEQILGNLISNVEKYAADGNLLCVESRFDGNQLKIAVMDRGPGIGSRDTERIFEPFVRLASDISSAAGTGIGLSIARQLARLHGGDVVLKNSSAGAHFEVTLSCV